MVFFGAVRPDSSNVVATVAGSLGQLAGVGASTIKVSAFTEFPARDVAPAESDAIDWRKVRMHCCWPGRVSHPCAPKRPPESQSLSTQNSRLGMDQGTRSRPQSPRLAAPTSGNCRGVNVLGDFAPGRRTAGRNCAPCPRLAGDRTARPVRTRRATPESLPARNR